VRAYLSDLLERVWERLVGRLNTDATVYGTRASWRRQLTIDYARRNDTWRSLRSVATTW